MIEVVFSDSACGSLKVAQHYGKGKYQGGSIGIIGNHDATKEEVETARREAEEKAQKEAAAKTKRETERADKSADKMSDAALLAELKKRGLI